MNNELESKASSDAQAYAMKKKQQMERAAYLRAERKNSQGNNLKSAASDMLTTQKELRPQHS